MAVRASLRYDDGFVPLNLVAVSDALRWARKTFPSRYTKTPA